VHSGSQPFANKTIWEEHSMACFLVSAAEAVVVTAAAQIMKNSEMKADSQKLAKKAANEETSGKT
jgi:hypothetical protein